MHDKRAHSRLPVRIEVTCTTEVGVSVTGITRDLSVGGMFVESSEVPAFGANVSVTFRENQIAVPLPGIVRWTKPEGFGVQFQLLGARETHALAKLLKA